MFQEIIVAIDGSVMSEKALQVAFSIAKGLHSNITLVHVRKEFLPYAVGDELEQAIKNEVEELLNEAKDQGKSRGIDVKILYLTGDPARQIVDHINHAAYDLVVIGNRGLSNFEEMLLGSVSHKISQLASCPVLIVK